MSVILEFSEKQNYFHTNRGDVEENTNGYETIGKTSEEYAYGFVQYMRRNFVHKQLTFLEVKELFDKYLNN